MTQGEQTLVQANGSNKRIEGDLYRQTVASLDGCEARLQKMQAVEKLHEVSLKVVASIDNIVNSTMSESLKSTALKVLYKVADNAADFEKLVVDFRETNRVP